MLKALRQHPLMVGTAELLVDAARYLAVVLVMLLLPPRSPATVTAGVLLEESAMEVFLCHASEDKRLVGNHSNKARMVKATENLRLSTHIPGDTPNAAMIFLNHYFGRSRSDLKLALLQEVNSVFGRFLDRKGWTRFLFQNLA